MRELIADARLAVRLLIKNPVFTTVAIVALGLGIGANTAIFSVVNAVLLRPLAYGDPDRLVMVWEANPSRAEGGDARSPVRPAVLNDWKAMNRVFEDMAHSSDAMYTLTGSGDPVSLRGYRFSANFLRVLGMQPMLGRGFTEDDDKPGAPPVVLLGHKTWQERFGGDREIVGRTLTLNGIPYSVIGVMPPGFTHPGQSEMWTPVAVDPAMWANRERRFLRVVARLKPGVTVEQARREMETIAGQLAARHEQDKGWTVQMETIRERDSGDVRTPLLALLGAVGFVLLIACANVANLSLARAVARQKEVAVRVALGATRWRLLRQFLTESLVLAVLGGALGLLLAFWSTGALLAIFPNNIANLSIPEVTALPLDLRVWAFTAVISLLTGMLFGVFPALQGTRADLATALKDTTRGATFGQSRARFRSALVVAETALALVLLAGAGLMVRSFVQLQRADLGIDPNNVVTAQVLLPRQKYSDEAKRRAFVHDVLARIEGQPGVQASGATNYLPLTGFWGTASFQVEGRPPAKPGEEPSADHRVATPGYLKAIGIRLLRGRQFTEFDRDGTQRVALVNETLARRYFPNEDPLGKRLNLGEPQKPEWWQIVGVVADVRSFGLHEEAHAEMFLPYDQVPYGLIAFTVRTGGSAAEASSQLKRAIWAVDKDQAIFKLIAMEQLAAESIALRRVSMMLFAAFAALALLLASVGIYGVMSYTVTQRTQEIGIRMALGARYQDVLSLVVGQGMRLVAAGLAIGLVAALVLTRVLATLLYGVRPNDPLTFAIMALVLLAVAFAANYLPARRAGNLDPLAALRYE